MQFGGLGADIYIFIENLIRCWSGCDRYMQERVVSSWYMCSYRGVDTCNILIKGDIL